MKTLLFFVTVLSFICFAQSGELKPNEKIAYSEKDSLLKNIFEKNKLNYPADDLLFRVFKFEKQFEVWAKNKNSKKYKLLKTYNICFSSGKLGPKRQEGDLQVPEGFYNIIDVNPYSSFFLSLGLNYPNESDKILTTNPEHPGSDIYIHGDCVSTGCIPLSDDIKEVYLMAMMSYKNGNEFIPVHIYPFKFDKQKSLYKEYKKEMVLTKFWKQLEKGYNLFNKSKKIQKFIINEKGDYIFNWHQK